MAKVDINQNVNVSIPELGDLGRIISGLQADIEKLGNIFTGAGGNSTRPNGERATLLGGGSNAAPPIELKADKVTAKLEEVVRALRDASRASMQERMPSEDKIAERRKRNEEDARHERELNKIRAENREARREERISDKRGNWLRGTVMAASLAGVYVAGSYGKVAGSQAGSVNAGVLNYNQFMQDYFNKQQDATQNLKSTGAYAAAAGAWAIGGPWAGIPASVLAMGYDYLSNSNTEASKQNNKFAMDQQLSGWRLNQSGLGGQLSNTSLQSGYGNLQMSELQAKGYNKDYAGYSTTLVDTTLGGKRDVMRGMSDIDKLDYNRKLTLTSMLLGTDMPNLNKNATVLSSVTGKTPDKILNDLLYTNQRYGGDTAANTGKLVNLLETTHMGYTAANDLVNKYQYNDALFNNQVAQQTATPMQLFQKNVLMRLAGANNAEIEAGAYNSKHMARYYKSREDAKRGILDPIGQIMAMSMQSTGENIMAQNVGLVTPSKDKFNPATTNTTMKQMADWVNNSLSNIKVETQQVQATNVYITGNVQDANGMSHPNIEGSTVDYAAHLPSTGVSHNVADMINTYDKIHHIHSGGK